MTATLDRIGMIVAPTMRSRAYAQMLTACGLKPALALHIPAKEAAWTGAESFHFEFKSLLPHFSFRPDIPAQETLGELGVTPLTMADSDINAPAVIRQIEALPIDVLIYSGLSKVLLKRDLLRLSKRFLHVHGGYVPAYRGATAFYFGLLERGLLGESAIWLDEGVDTGPLIARDWYRPIQGVDIDRVMDPVARAHLLARVLTEYARTGAFPSEQIREQSESYFIIHPVLKHLALAHAAESAGDAHGSAPSPRIN